MATSTLKKLLKEYEQKRLSAFTALDKRKNDLYLSNSRLSEIDTELNNFAISTAKSILSSNSSKLINNLKQKIEILKKEKSEILANLGIDDSFFSPKFECCTCNDTGYVETETHEYCLCNCIKQRLFDIEYNNSNLANLEKENFDNFDENLYSSIVNEDLYSSNISPRDNIKNIKNIAFSFIKNFDNPDEKNLLFIGNTGLGKTFFSSCIANELLKIGKTVLYQTSSTMLDNIINFRFEKKPFFNQIYDNILNADLLIIDDLGTEYLNSMKFSELFNIINSRLLSQNNHITKTIISSNLTLQNLKNNYDERIFSRFVGNYNICRFFGDDIRLRK